jgi:GNAT acetyltransferase-like protein
MMIRPATAADATSITHIYNYYIVESVVTFEEDPIDVSEMVRRIESVRSARLPWLVADQDGVIAGYAYATPWKERRGYRFSVETTIYLAKDFQAAASAPSFTRNCFGFWKRAERGPRLAALRCLTMPALRCTKKWECERWQSLSEWA